MSLLVYELKKLFSGVALWVFIGLCLAFNIWAMPTWLNRDFDTTTPFHENVFEHYNTSDVAEIYVSGLGLTGGVAESMRAKYDALQVVVDRNAIAGVSYSPYFGEYTYLMHTNLFNNIGVLGRLLMQGMLLAVLIALLSVGYEKANHTEHSVYATKTGRRILRHKIAASLVAGIGIYAALTAVTLAIYFTIFDFSNVWSSSVSSGFNFIDSAAGIIPFTTWQSFTVASYLLAVLGVSLGLVLCFSLMGAAIGTLLKNGYFGFLAVVMINAVCLMLLPRMASVNSYAFYVSLHTPIWLWWNSGLWFTDGECFTLWRNFELWGLGASVVILATLCIASVKIFEKRNIA